MTTEVRKKCCYIGAPKVFALEAACRLVNEAFGEYGCYLVGSALERADWRDVDIRLIMPDENFRQLFPDAHSVGARWEFDARWLLINTSIAEHLSRITGLPVDFQIQPQNFANEKHPGQRSAIGLRIAKPEPPELAERDHALSGELDPSARLREPESSDPR